MRDGPAHLCSSSPPTHGRARQAATCLTAAILALGTALSSCAEETTKAPAPARTERSLPRFEGPRIDGGRAGSELLRKRRGLVMVFASGDPEAGDVAGIVRRIAADAAGANIAFLGVSRDRDPELARIFVRRHELTFPVVLERDGELSRKLQLPAGRSAVLLVDAEGYLVGGFAGLQGDVPDLVEAYEAELRGILHLEKLEGAVTPALGLLPEAPPFEVEDLAGQGLSLKELRGKVVVLVFFSPTCPHCHEALEFLSGLSKKLASGDLRIVPVSVSNRRYVIEDMVERLELELPMYVDPESTARRAYAHRHVVPDTIVIDRQGRVVSRVSGADARTQALLTTEIRHALGVKNPILLDRVGYSGEESCRTCHRDQHQTWTLTNHAYAFETLVQHGAERNPECLPCHTVGWQEPGGYSLEQPYPHLGGVQCENCHGRGGPHQSPGFLANGYEPVCLTCHTEKHSLNFHFALRLPDISHAYNQRFASLGLEERKALLERRDRFKGALFEEGSYVGSAACQDCHRAEYGIWSKSAHARAFTSLEKRDGGSKPDCQRCHSTGFQEAGGFPQGGDPLRHVGCESCHGPGAKHAEEGTEKRGSILALTDKCDSCVILQICGSCHDDDNDPGFEFELNDKLETIRHGFRDAQSAQR